MDPISWEGETAKAFQELDSYCGGTGGTLKKLQDDKNGKEVSVRSGCLVRCKPMTEGNARDITYIQYPRRDCGTQHKWGIQRGYLQPALIGRFDNVLSPTSGHVEALLEAILNAFDSSHICHNSACSDPFHFHQESRAVNLQGNKCLFRRVGVCVGRLRCRVEQMWPNRKYNWSKVKKPSDAERVPLAKFGWECTKGFLSDSKPVSNTLAHWRKSGCRKGGTFVRVFHGREFNRSYDRYNIETGFKAIVKKFIFEK